MTDLPLVRVRNYARHFHAGKTLVVNAVNGISFDIRRGEIFALVGESGSGKSTVARSVAGIYRPSRGTIHFKDILLSDRREYRRAKKDIQQNIQLIFQDSAAALNPRMRVRDIIAEPLILNRLLGGKKEYDDRVGELLDVVGLDPLYADKYPSEISGGQRQRVAIARSIGPEPELIIADEPVAALDVSIQAQIVGLLDQLRREKNFTFLFIAHDLSMVRYLSDRVGVMHSGKLVELAPTRELFANPLHPYTQSLFSAIPIPDPRLERARRFVRFDGVINADADMREVSEGHWVLP